MRLAATIHEISGSRKSQRGLSLLEILVTTAIATVVFGIGLPSMKTVLLKYNLKAAANDIANSVEYARSRAILKNKPITFSIANNTFGATGNDTGGFSIKGFSTGISTVSSEPVTITLKANGTTSPQSAVTLKNQDGMTVTLTIYTSGKVKVSDVAES